MSARVFADDRGRHLHIEVRPAEELGPGDKDPPTTAREAHRVMIDALLDYHRADPVAFWRTMKSRGIHVICSKHDELPYPKMGLDVYLCPNCGHGGEHDALCPQCQEETEL